MMEVSVREIIEYARNIEAESFAFYNRAADVLTRRAAREVTLELAAEEEKHFRRLGRLLEDDGLASAALDTRVAGGVDLSDRVVPTMEITPDSTARAILEVALQREERTRDQYRTFISFTGLDSAVTAVFEDLVEQEEGHARRVRALLERLGD